MLVGNSYTYTPYNRTHVRVGQKSKPHDYQFEWDEHPFPSKNPSYDLGFTLFTPLFTSAARQRNGRRTQVAKNALTV